MLVAASNTVEEAVGQPPVPVPTKAGAIALEAARGYAQEALSQATRRAYEADWAHYQG